MKYKQQIFETLQIEHAAILAEVRRQEVVLQNAKQHYVDLNEEFCECKRTGITVVDAMSYESGLRLSEKEIEVETQKLETIRRREEAKRAEMIESKVENASLEKLREKKLIGYQKEVQKDEERFIEELVSATRLAASQ